MSVPAQMQASMPVHVALISTHRAYSKDTCIQRHFAKISTQWQVAKTSTHCGMLQISAHSRIAQRSVRKRQAHWRIRHEMHQHARLIQENWQARTSFPCLNSQHVFLLAHQHAPGFL